MSYEYMHEAQRCTLRNTILQVCVFLHVFSNSFTPLPAVGNPLHNSCVANPEHSVYLGKLQMHKYTVLDVCYQNICMILLKLQSADMPAV